MVDALGIIETTGFTPAMQAADAAVKSANVTLGTWIKVAADGSPSSSAAMSRR